MQPRDSDITLWTALYVIALILTWLSLFSIERFAETDLRAWAPFFQGLITAAAIVSAWLLHDAKRRGDLADAQASLATAYQALSLSLEDWAGFLDEVVSNGHFSQQTAERNIEAFREEVGALRSLPLEKLGTPEAVRRAQMFAVGCRQFLASLEEARGLAVQGLPIPPHTLQGRLRALVRRRNRLLMAFGLPSEDTRLRRWPRAQAFMR